MLPAAQAAHAGGSARTLDSAARPRPGSGRGLSGAPMNPTKMKFPRPLQHGDRIAVSALSSGVPPAMHARLDLALSTLRERGFEVIDALQMVLGDLGVPVLFDADIGHRPPR